ncbi:adenylate/guanylate cyclase domain-containing protein [Thiobacillus sp. 65-1402]|uniref:adenylate/guanylate cyclase domain-containing protein n=1 Tax=Thiobacillus sp. 65-1402 TaxID=1895861 RepID=UPI000959CC94|nr:adenylate/guanylate cyclase domain-containing protein [Thiobacillus sp. 65-1402]OJW76547.1 MAG: adenylate/guanylate cyclase domain-containing protein [Thiobacillus sp. 65-1402]
MRLPISLKIFSITLALLVLMVVVTWLSVLNFRQLNNQVRALSDWYLPLQQQVASVEILIRQQMVHMERVMAGMDAARPDPEFIANESTGFDMRGINADQIVDSSLRMLGEAEAQQVIQLDRVTLAVLGKQLPAIQTARQQFHRSFRLFQIEAEEGNPRSEKLVREALLREKDRVDVEIGKTIDLLNKLTQDTAAAAKAEEARATTLNWIVTAIATALGLIFAAFVTRSLVDPVKRLLGGTRAVEAGDLEVEIQVRTHDELATLATSFNHMVVGLREKERIRETFGQYVDPRIVRNLLENRIPAERGERQVMTVFFSDLESFTRMCEGLTPDAAVRFLNRYFAMMADVIRARQGIVDKYIGDSVMAFWGPPFTDPADHARLGCLAALEQMRKMEAFRAALPDLFGMKQGLPEVNVRMGVASGEVTVGNIGSETSRGYTVIGDTVNLASRLEQANKFYGTRILVSEGTRSLAGDSFVFREIDSLRVVGKLEPVKVFELIGLADEVSDTTRKAVQAYESGLARYRAQDWEAAEAAFHDCLVNAPGDKPSQVMLERIAAFRQAPPEAGWDGVWVAGSK